MANERTFLAWLRTSLALLAAGVALEALRFPEQPGFRLAAALVFISLGLSSAVHAWWGWMSAERALRLASALPGLAFGAVLVAGIALGIALVVIGSLL